MGAFYVYELRDGAGVVFYVGKGSGRRMWQHKYKAKAGEFTRRGDRIRAILAAGGSVAPVKVFETDDEEEAYREETALIAKHGRANLTNSTDGGSRGPRNITAETRERLAAARRGKKASEMTRQRLREAHLGTTRPAEVKARIAAKQRTIRKPWAVATAKILAARNKIERRGLGVPMPDEIKAKISAARMGHAVSAETRAKISASKRRKTVPLPPAPAGFLFDPNPEPAAV